MGGWVDTMAEHNTKTPCSAGDITVWQYIFMNRPIKRLK